MNESSRATLVREPRPADADWAGVVGTREGWRVSWLREGRIAEPFGPPFLFAKDAAAAAHFVREAHGLDR